MDATEDVFHIHKGKKRTKDIRVPELLAKSINWFIEQVMPSELK